MNSALVALNPEDVSKRIAATNQRMQQYRQSFKSLDELTKIFRSKQPACEDGDCAQRWFMHYALELAGLEHAAGAGTARIREILQEAVQAYAPIVPLLDYSPRKREFAVHSSHVQKFKGGKRPSELDSIVAEPVRHPISEYQMVYVTVKNQPALDAMKEAMTCALMVWDFKAAKGMAERYLLEPRFGGDAPNRFGLFREAILGNSNSALAFLGRTLDYSTEKPPERHELAEGCIRGDGSMMRVGLRTVSARFKSVWSLNTYRTPAKLRRYGSMEKMLPDIHRHLLGGSRWLFSDWAIAWMVLAWHRGIKEAFSDTKLFSKWVPLELCCPEPWHGGAEK